MSEKKHVLSAPLKEVADFIANSKLSGFDAIILANWLLSAFVKGNINLVPEFDSDDNSDVNE